MLARSRGPLLRWFAPRRGAYPWRRTRDPYAILVSEVMLQQTQAARVVPAFERFLSVFPSVEALASAARSDVVRAWGGLGYNRRAVALWLAARELLSRDGGRVPADVPSLQALPGVGPYTAAAVASIAFGTPVAAIDTNVRRVVSRVVDTSDRSRIEAAASEALDPADPGGWNQAVMDLGREVCRPAPACDVCPIRSWCASAGSVVVARQASRLGSSFEGSTRQARGAVVRALRAQPVMTLGRLSTAAAARPALDRVDRRRARARRRRPCRAGRSGRAASRPGAAGLTGGNAFREAARPTPQPRPRRPVPCES